MALNNDEARRRDDDVELMTRGDSEDLENGSRYWIQRCINSTCEVLAFGSGTWVGGFFFSHCIGTHWVLLRALDRYIDWYRAFGYEERTHS